MRFQSRAFVRAGCVPMHNIVPRLSESPGGFRRPAPSLGQHTREILDELGM